MVHRVDANSPSVDREGPGPEALSACAAGVWRGIFGLAPAFRATVLSLFKAMGTNAVEPMVTTVPIPIDTVLAEPALGKALGGRSNEDIDATLRQTITRLRNLRFRDVCDDADLTESFARSPFLDIGEVVNSAQADRPVDGWLVRCGQWAYWCLSHGDREALCRLARRHLAAAANDGLAVH